MEVMTTELVAVVWQVVAGGVLLKIGWKIVDYTVDRFLKKTVEADYVTRADCEHCKRAESAKDSVIIITKQLNGLEDKLDKRLGQFRDALILHLSSSTDPTMMKEILRVLKEE